MKKSSNGSKTRKKRSMSLQPSSSEDVRSIPKIELQKDLSEFVELCLSKGVEFLLVGGYAMAVHGAPRFTEDIDFFVKRSPENAKRIIEVLRSFDVSESDVSVEDLVSEKQVVQVGRKPNRVDVLTSIDGVEWEEAWSSRVEVSLSGNKCWAIGRNALVKNKRSSGRMQDLADAAKLEK